MNCKKLALIIAFVAVIAPTFAKQCAEFKYMGTSIISLPTAYTRSSAAYIRDNGRKCLFVSQCFFTDAIEVSVKRYQNGPQKNSNIMSAKLKLIDEKLLIPTVTYGVSDIYKDFGERVYYFAASKTIDAFGVMLHGGVYRDPIKKENVKYFGGEKIILPLISVCAERCGDVNTYGIKLSPYPGLNLEVSRRDKDEEIYNVNYYLSY